MDCNQFDTFESLIMECINRSLSAAEFALLDNEIDNWNSLYLKFFINIYLQRCNLPGITYRILNMLTFEPILLQADAQISRRNEPSIIHSISIPYLQLIFNLRDRVELTTRNCASFVKLPSIFPMLGGGADDYIDSDCSSRVLSKRLSKRLMNFYVHADHAAYHYNKFIRDGDAGYEHNEIRNRIPPSRPRDVKYCHDIITTRPNKELVNYLKSHDIIKVEDSIVADGYCNSGDIFEPNIDSDDDN